MTRHRGKAPSQRQLRVGEQLRHALSDLFTRDILTDPELAGVSITVSEVRASPDLKVAHVYLLPFAAADPEPVMAALSRAAPFLRRQLARTLNLRYTPELRFYPDTSFDEAAHIEHLLQSPRVRRDIDAAPATSADTDAHDGET